MKTPISTEMLSAYLDDELTPAERAAVEELLHDTAIQERAGEAKATLDEFAEVSSLLGELPRHSAPDGLQVNVMQQIAAQSSPEPAVPTTTVTERPRKRGVGWNWRIAGSLIASAALLLVMVQVADMSDESIAPSVADNSLEVEPLTMAAPQGEAARTLALSEQEFAQKNAMLANAAKSMRLDSAGAEEVSDMVAPQSITPQDFFAQRLLTKGKAPRPGEVLSYLKTNGDQVMVIEVTVIDVARVADRFSVLLNETGIESVNQADAVASMAGEADTSNQLRAIFVETDSNRLMSALESASGQEDVLRMRVSRPLEIAQIESQLLDEGYAKKESAEKQPAEESSTRSSIASTEGLPADRAELDSTDDGGYLLTADNIARLREKQTTERPAVQDDARQPTEEHGYQVAMNVPSELIEELADRKQQVSQTTINRERQAKDGAEVPMQVLFVLSPPR